MASGPRLGPHRLQRPPVCTHGPRDITGWRQGAAQESLACGPRPDTGTTVLSQQPELCQVRRSVSFLRGAQQGGAHQQQGPGAGLLTASPHSLGQVPHTAQDSHLHPETSFLTSAGPKFFSSVVRWQSHSLTPLEDSQVKAKFLRKIQEKKKMEDYE